MGFRRVLALTLLLVSARAQSADPVTVLDLRSDTFQNLNCELNRSCDLESFSIQVEQYAVALSEGELSFGTRMSARYETRAIDQLGEFGIVQFLRGCQYSSHKDGASIVRARDISIPWREGENIPYYFPELVIDGPSPDPLDWGYEPMPSSRHYYYWWNEIPGSTNPGTGHYAGESPPTNPALYVQDLPGSAFFDEASGEAHNISLHFRTCLYRTSGVPKNVPPNELAFAEPLHCFNWMSSWVYDHEMSSMESPTDLVEFCR